MNKYQVIVLGSDRSGKIDFMNTLKNVTAYVNHEKHYTSLIDEHAKLISVDIVFKDKKIKFYPFKSEGKSSTIWDMLFKQASGVVFLLNCSQPSAKTELLDFIDYCQANALKNIVVGLTSEESDAACLALDESIDILESKGLVLPVFSLDTRIESDVLLIVATVVSELEALTNPK